MVISPFLFILSVLCVTVSPTYFIFNPLITFSLLPSLTQDSEGEWVEAHAAKPVSDECKPSDGNVSTAQNVQVMFSVLSHSY